MNEPTKEELRGFWEWCGFSWHDNYWGTLWCEYPDGSKHSFHPEAGADNSQYVPLLSLDNLFKYAVPKLTKEGYEVFLVATDNLCEVEINDRNLPPTKQSQLSQDKDPALALYHVIQKARGKGV